MIKTIIAHRAANRPKMFFKKFIRAKMGGITIRFYSMQNTE